MPYIGPQPIPKATQVRSFGTLGAPSTTITVPGGFTPGNVEVYVNGLYVQPTDYDDSTSPDLVFTETLPIGTDYLVMEARTFEVSNTPTLFGGAEANFINMPQVGGDPIVESGSNSDGEWVRWADGTQICICFSTTITTSAVWTTNLFRAGVSFTFAIPFITSEISAVAAANKVTNSLPLATTRFFDTTTAEVHIVSDGSANEFNVNVTAFGRWK